MLDTKGLTSSEAKRVANLLKEIVKGIDISAENFKIATASAIRDGQSYRLDDNEAITDWDTKLIAKARYYTLSAWLNEAIKYKDALIALESSESFNEDSLDLDLKNIPNKPVEQASTFEDYLNTLSVGDRTKYLASESLCAHIGKFIHNFDTVREKFENFKPTTFTPLNGNESLTVINTLLYDKPELFDKADGLMGIYREESKVVNYYKAQHKEWAANNRREYQIAYGEWIDERSALVNHNNKVIGSARARFETAKTNELERLSALKIIVPVKLQEILDEVYAKFDVE